MTAVAVLKQRRFWTKAQPCPVCRGYSTRGRRACKGFEDSTRGWLYCTTEPAANDLTSTFAEFGELVFHAYRGGDSFAMGATVSEELGERESKQPVGRHGNLPVSARNNFPNQSPSTKGAPRLNNTMGTPHTAPTKWRLLSCVQKYGALTQREYADRLGVSRAAVRKALRSLALNGYLPTPALDYTPRQRETGLFKKLVPRYTGVTEKGLTKLHELGLVPRVSRSVSAIRPYESPGDLHDYYTKKLREFESRDRRRQYAQRPRERLCVRFKEPANPHFLGA